MAITTTAGAPPATIQAGDTIPWTASFSDHPATSWTLRYFFTKEGSDPIEILATASGTDYAVTLTAEDSGQFVGGRWDWKARASLQGTGSIVVDSGYCDVMTDPSAPRIKSIAERAVEMIERSFMNDLPTMQESYSVTGADITKMGFQAREDLLNQFKARVARERRRRREEAGAHSMGEQVIFKN